MMTLRFLPANAAYVFTFGDQLTRMGDGPMFHTTRASAVEYARRQGLGVTRMGDVVALESDATQYAKHVATMADVEAAIIRDAR